MRQTLWQVQQGRNQSVVALPGPAAAMAEGLWARAPRLWLPVPVRSRGGGEGERGMWVPRKHPGLLCPPAPGEAETIQLSIHSTSHQACLPGAVLGPGDVTGI